MQAPESYVPPSSHVFRDRLLDDAYKDVQARLAGIPSPGQQLTSLFTTCYCAMELTLWHSKAWTVIT